MVRPGMGYRIHTTGLTHGPDGFPTQEPVEVGGAMAILGGLCGGEALQLAVRGGIPSAYREVSLAALAQGAALAEGAYPSP